MTSNLGQDLAQLVNDFVSWSETPEGHAAWSEIYTALLRQTDCNSFPVFNANNWDDNDLSPSLKIDCLEQIYKLNVLAYESNNTHDDWFIQSRNWAEWHLFIRRLYFKLYQPPIIRFLLEVANQD